MLRSIDKILIAHRNSKLFLFMMSGPFYLLLTIVKYSLKVMIIYYLYKKKKRADELKAHEEGKAAGNTTDRKSESGSG